MRQAYEITLNNNDGEEITLKLRIDIRGQMAIKKKYGEEAATVIGEAISDIEKMAFVLTQALTYKHNENSITDGADLYDLLVDNGYAGPIAFAEFLTTVAVYSGAMDEESKEEIDSLVRGTYRKNLSEETGKNEKNAAKTSEK